MSSTLRSGGSSSTARPSSSTSPPPSSASGLLKEYLTAAIPEKQLAFTNHVYFSPSTHELLAARIQAKEKVKGQDVLVQIKDLVFTARPHEAIKSNEVAIGVRHRESLKIPSTNKEGDTLPVKPFLLPKDGSYNLINIRLELVPLDGKKKIAVKEAELTPFLKSMYGQQVLTRNQVIVIDYDNNKFNLIVRQLEAFKPVDSEDEDDDDNNTKDKDTVTQFIDQGIFLTGTTVDFQVDEGSKLFKFERSAMNARGKLFNPDWKFEDMGIGGLDTEFSAIFRRAFASRLFPPEIIAQLGIKHVRGMLLYGPPGTGKTLIARQIGKMLAGREPQVVNGPEILNKFVGASEENIRKLFQPAEDDYAQNKENADLHIIIFDEIDAICKARGSTSGGTGVQDTVVNQLLSKMDGVNSPNNLLVIGMTNRKDMLDPALLRPGRLEVHIEISLPDERGREQILNIKTRDMKANGKLGSDVNIPVLAEKTKNFSGAELEGLVKSATSYALYGCIDTNKGGKGAIGVKDADLARISVTMSDFLSALDEVTPAFGVAEDALKALIHGDLYDFGMEYHKLIDTSKTLIQQVRTSPQTRLMSVLLSGVAGSGKTAIAAQIGLESQFPFVKLISAEQYLGMSEAGKSAEIARIFEDAYKSPLSLIILDGIERLLDYVPIGPRFSNQVLQTLTVLTARHPPKPKHKLMIIGTTADVEILEEMQLRPAFNVVLKVPQVSTPSQVKEVFQLSKAPAEASDLDTLKSECPLPIPIKTLLLVMEMARQNDQGTITPQNFAECVTNAGLEIRSYRK